MRRRHKLDLQALPGPVAAALEATLSGEEIALVRGGERLGTLHGRPAVLDGTVIEGAGPTGSSAPAPEGATVVATAMELSDRARRRLADGLGEGYVVLDLHEAPPTADVLLVPPISPQLLGALRVQFPQARVLVTEIEDEELGVHYAGPVRRMLEAGAAGYLPPRPVTELAGAVHAHLTGQEQIALDAPAPRPHRRELGPGGLTEPGPAPSR